jgi:hypothetical protein
VRPQGWQRAHRLRPRGKFQARDRRREHGATSIVGGCRSGGLRSLTGACSRIYLFPERRTIRSGSPHNASGTWCLSGLAWSLASPNPVRGKTRIAEGHVAPECFLCQHQTDPSADPSRRLVRLQKASTGHQRHVLGAVHAARPWQAGDARRPQSQCKRGALRDFICACPETHMNRKLGASDDNYCLSRPRLISGLLTILFRSALPVRTPARLEPQRRWRAGSGVTYLS